MRTRHIQITLIGLQKLTRDLTSTGFFWRGAKNNFALPFTLGSRDTEINRIAFFIDVVWITRYLIHEEILDRHHAKATGRRRPNNRYFTTEKALLIGGVFTKQTIFYERAIGEYLTYLTSREFIRIPFCVLNNHDVARIVRDNPCNGSVDEYRVTNTSTF